MQSILLFEILQGYGYERCVTMGAIQSQSCDTCQFWELAEVILQMSYRASIFLHTSGDIHISGDTDKSCDK